MGFIRHHAIVVTTYNTERIETAHAKARELGLCPTEITLASLNGFRSFLIPPDGSKEGWPESYKGDSLRETWKEWADSEAFDDGSTPYCWVEINYGEDYERGYSSEITQDAWAKVPEIINT